MELFSPFSIERPPIYAVPVIPYSFESAAHLVKAVKQIEPDCIVTDLPSALEKELLQAAGRLPEPTLIRVDGRYLLAESADPSFEALRSGLERGLPVHMIHPSLIWGLMGPIPDTYALYRLGMKQFWHAIEKEVACPLSDSILDEMARRLKELTYSYDRILFAGNVAWINEVLLRLEKGHFNPYKASPVGPVETGTLTEEAAEQVPSTCGWMVTRYEKWREQVAEKSPLPDRQKLIYYLYKEAAALWSERIDTPFPENRWPTLMKFVRNWSLKTDKLLPDLYQIITAAKGCVEDSYALAVWKLAVEYPFLKNIDNLPPWNVKPEEVWGGKHLIHFRLKEKGKKSALFARREKGQSQWRFEPPGPFSICSYQPEDKIVEGWADYLKKKGTQILSEEGARIVPFSGSLEDGIDVRETIRHFAEKRLYVKTKGKPPGAVGSVVLIFDEDKDENKYPWKSTWLGEHDQESDMAFYATSLTHNVVGPGISRCEYGGFMMSYPPRRLYDVWQDPDYRPLLLKHEVLLAAAIDYSTEPLIVYAAEKPPRSTFKTYAARFGKKIVYFPLKELALPTRSKIRTFHVLDNKHRRSIADEYII